MSYAPLTERILSDNPISITLPDGSKIELTHVGMLDIPQLPRAARIRHVILGPNLHSLISVVTLRNARCEVVFTKIGVTVKYRGTTILMGSKCTRTGLWMVPLNISTINTANLLCETPPKHQVFQPQDFYNLYDLKFGTRKQTHQENALIPTSIKGESARYYHQCIGLPPRLAILGALPNYPDELQLFSGFNKEVISKYLPPSRATAKGHITGTQRISIYQKQPLRHIGCREDKTPKYCCTAI